MICRITVVYLIEIVMEEKNKTKVLTWNGILIMAFRMFELRLPGPDDEKPPLEERYLPNVSDVDSLSFTESESLADSASVILEG